MLSKQNTEISADGEFLCDFKSLMNFIVKMSHQLASRRFSVVWVTLYILSSSGQSLPVAFKEGN